MSLSEVSKNVIQSLLPTLHSFYIPSAVTAIMEDDFTVNREKRAQVRSFSVYVEVSRHPSEFHGQPKK